MPSGVLAAFWSVTANVTTAVDGDRPLLASASGGAIQPVGLNRPFWPSEFLSALRERSTELKKRGTINQFKALLSVFKIEPIGMEPA